MKFQDALRLVEEFKEIKDGESMSARLDKANDALKHDLEDIRKVVKNNIRKNLSWREMAFSNYAELLDNFWKLKENASEFLRKRKIYDLNPTGTIAVSLNRKYGVGNDSTLEIAKKTVIKYSLIYSQLKELTALIREYNSKKLGTYMNIPSVEFKISLREEVEDVYHGRSEGAY